MKERGLKFVSLLIALSLAIYVTSESNSSVLNVMVPIEVRGLPSDRVILISSAAQAKVSLYGPSFMLSRFNASAPVFRVDFPKDTGNRFKAALNPGQLGLPSAVDVRLIDPSEVQFTVDEILTRVLEVKVQKIGDLPKGFSLVDVVVEPPRVEVSGAQTDLKNLTHVETIPLDLRDIRGSREMELELLDPGRFSSSKLRHVKVRVNVQAESKERKFEKVEIEVRSREGHSYVLNPKTVNVEISGPMELVDALQPGEIQPYVRLEPDLAVPAKLQVALDLPPHIELIALKPEKVTVSQNGAKIK